MTSTKVRKISRSDTRLNNIIFKSRVNRIKRILAEKIYERRIEFGLSQETLGQMINVDRKTINRIENGHFSPSLDTLVRIFAALDIKAKSVFEPK